MILKKNLMPLKPWQLDFINEMNSLAVPEITPTIKRPGTRFILNVDDIPVHVEAGTLIDQVEVAMAAPACALEMFPVFQTPAPTMSIQDVKNSQLEFQYGSGLVVIEPRFVGAARRIGLQLRTFKYKPNFEFAWFFSTDSLNLQIKFRSECVDTGTTETFAGLKRVLISEVDGGDLLTKWLWSEIKEAELHEAGEWFTIDGERPFNPHANSRHPKLKVK